MSRETRGALTFYGSIMAVKSDTPGCRPQERFLYGTVLVRHVALGLTARPAHLAAGLASLAAAGALSGLLPKRMLDVSLIS